MTFREQELWIKKREIDLLTQRLEIERVERKAAIDAEKAQTNLILKKINKINKTLCVLLFVFFFY